MTRTANLRDNIIILRSDDPKASSWDHLNRIKDDYFTRSDITNVVDLDVDFATFDNARYIAFKRVPYSTPAAETIPYRLLIVTSDDITFIDVEDIKIILNRTGKELQRLYDDGKL